MTEGEETITPPGALNARQWRAVEALVEGCSYAEAAQAGDVSPRRLYEWRQQPAFREALDRALVELHDRVHGRLEGLAELAVDRLRQVLEHGEDRVAVRAALGVLDRAGHAKPSSPAAVAIAGSRIDVGPNLTHISTDDLERLLRLGDEPS